MVLHFAHLLQFQYFGRISEGDVPALFTLFINCTLQGRYAIDIFTGKKGRRASVRKFTYIQAILVTGILFILGGCSLISSSNPHSLTIAVSGGVYGELEPCG